MGIILSACDEVEALKFLKGSRFVKWGASMAQEEGEVGIEEGAGESCGVSFELAQMVNLSELG